VTAISESFEGTLDRIVAALPLPSDLPCEGLLLTGSYARGEAGPGSDVDLLAIVRGRVVWRSFYYSEGYDVDLFAYGFGWLTRQLRDRRQPLVQIAARSRVLRDHSGKAAQVQALAREALAGPPPPRSPHALAGYAQRISTALSDVLSVAESEPNLAIALAIAELPGLVDFYFGLRGEWLLGLRRGMPVLRLLDAELAELVTRVMSTDDSSAKRVDAFRGSVQRVLRAAGMERRYFSTYLIDEREASRS
jgi:hypothetical protein